MLDWMLMPLRRYAEFSGRSRRKEYWSFQLLNFLVYVVLGGLLMAGGFSLASYGAGPAAMPDAPGPLFWIGGGLLALYALAVLIPSIAVTVRRLHDRDMSGWFALLFIVVAMIPLIGVLASIAFLVLMCLEGTKGPNKYGEDPKDPARTEVFA